MATKIVTLLDEDSKLSVLGEIMTLFGVKSKLGRTKKLNVLQLTIRIPIGKDKLKQ